VVQPAMNKIRAMGTNISKKTKEVKIARTFAVCDPWMAAISFSNFTSA
jgi:hypothetical protein